MEAVRASAKGKAHTVVGSQERRCFSDEKMSSSRHKGRFLIVSLSGLGHRM